LIRRGWLFRVAAPSLRKRTVDVDAQLEGGVRDRRLRNRTLLVGCEVLCLYHVLRIENAADDMR
jgi:hypothetical protein